MFMGACLRKGGIGAITHIRAMGAMGVKGTRGVNPRRVLVLNEHIPAHRTSPPHCELQCACKTAVYIAPGPAIVQ